MSENRFFQQVNATIADYSPVVPESVYAGMRKKLWWSNFTRLSVTRFNIWYLAILVTGTVALLSTGAADKEASTVEMNQAQQTLDAAHVSPVDPVKETSVAESVVEHQELSGQSAVAGSAKNGASTQSHTQVEQSAAEAGQNSVEVAPIAAENPSVAEPKTQTAETVETKPASKKGLRVKTYNAEEKKD